MIFHYVNPAFDRAQNFLASIEKSVFIKEDKVQRHTFPLEQIFGKSPESAITDQSVFVNRLLAVPVVAIDMSLEVIRSLALVVESVASVVMSLAVFICHIPQFVSLNELGKYLRITILNLNNMIENTVFGVMRLVAVPFLTLAQLWIAIADPLTYQPSSENFPICYNFKPASLQVPKDILTPHENDPVEFQARLYGQELKKDDPFAMKQIPSFTTTGFRPAFNEKKEISGLALIPITCIDAASEVIVALAKTIYHFVFSIVILIVTTFHSMNSLVRENGRMKLYANYRIGFASLNTSLYQLSHAISRVVMSPITLVSQLTKVLWDPKNAHPISEQLYRPHKGDQFMTIQGRSEYGYDQV